jgi:alpha/beta superfamily hydrolase
MKREHIVFPCGEIQLEGELRLPDRPLAKFQAAVVCHPHPLYGGDMDNNVVLTICDALMESGTAALRFNFRGVGSSEGRFGGGVEERKDIKAAFDYLSSRKDIDPDNLNLAGYSFGGAVALAAALEDNRIKKLALISPAISESSWTDLVDYSNPKLVLIGDSDTVISLSRIKGALTSNKDFQIINGADHFWWGYDTELTRRLASFFKIG